MRKHLNTLLNKFGLNLQRTSSSTLRTTMDEAYGMIKQKGFLPATVIDIGVANGTPELYSAFPSSYFLLIEPLSEFETDLKKIIHSYKGTYILAAAGRKKDNVVFNIHQNHLVGSSLYKEQTGAVADGHETIVPMVRIDDIITELPHEGAPFLIKVDVQGAELDALDGAQKTLCETEVIVLEVSLFEFMKGAPQLYDVIVYMKKHGFVAYDIIHGWNRPLDNALGQVDIVFVKENGLFRKDHSYSTVEQMKEIFGK